MFNSRQAAHKEDGRFARHSLSQILPLLRNKGFLLLPLLLLLYLLGPGIASSSSGSIPTFSIQSVATDQTVTITTYNFPAGQDFAVRMGPMGTLGINGYYVTTTNSGAGGSFTATYNIPEQLKGSYQISIRLESPQGYYSYNWFYNNTTGTGGTGYSGIPTFSIVNVNADQDVTIRTNNYPAGQTFTVTMGPMGTRGINGTVVGTIDSGTGGTLEKTFAIPDSLKGSYQISIRAQTAHANPYFSYNWFYNNTTGNGTGGDYTGIPTFSILSVVEDTEVTIRTNNFPAGQTFTVTMGPMGTRGINGTVVGTIDSGTGGTLERTFTIPDNLKGSYQISIRAQTAHANPYFAYNWFYNNTAGQGGDPPAPSPGYTGIPTIKICTVVEDDSVTFRTNNYPANQIFTVRMGPMGTQGIGGTVVGTFDSGSGGAFDQTFPIPDHLKGSYRISIRSETAHAYPYYSFNWFYNNTASVCD